MKIVKKISNWKEKRLGILLGVASSVVYGFYPGVLDVDNFVKEIISIGFIIFGFLITLLGIIIQSDNPTINKFREKSFYNRFIIYIKNCIFLSAIASVYAIMLTYLQIPIIDSLLIYSDYIGLTLNGLLIFLVVNLIINTYMFLNMFFALIHRDPSLKNKLRPKQ